MSDSTLRILLAVVLIFHGIGHGLGILSTIGIKLSRTQSSDSVILRNFLGEKTIRTVAFCIWVIVILCYIYAGTGLLGLGLSEGYWQPAAIFASILSILGLIFYWNAFPLLFPHKIGAVAVDIGTIVCLVWLKWPSSLIK